MLTNEVERRLNKAMAKYNDCSANIQSITKQQDQKKKAKVRDQVYVQIKYIHRHMIA